MGGLCDPTDSEPRNAACDGPGEDGGADERGIGAGSTPVPSDPKPNIPVDDGGPLDLPVAPTFPPVPAP